MTFTYFKKRSMNTFGIAEKSYNLMQVEFKKFSEIESVILFGSRAKSNYKSGSDIDLTLNGKHAMPLLALNISAQLNEELSVHYFIDVLDYNTIDNKELKAHADRVGILIYENKIS